MNAPPLPANAPTIVLVAIHPEPSPQAVPLANAFIKASAGACGCHIQLADFFRDDAVEHCVQRLLDSQPAAIGFSMYAWNRRACLDLARALRTRKPDMLLFSGGPEATAAPDGLLGADAFDAVVLGEGELPCQALFLRLAAGRTLDGIPGLLTGSVPCPVPAETVEELDRLPSPYLSGTLTLERHGGVLWQLSRGCGFACDFCFDARGSRRVRRFSLQRVEEELRLFAAAGVGQVFVLDSTFNQDASRAKAILRLIARHAPGIHFHFEVRSEFIDREMARLFAAVTCSLQIGLQSADPAVSAGVGRVFRPDDFRKRVDLLNASGATFGFDLMYGLPGDTLAGFRRSLDFSLALYPNHLDIFPLAILPGTALAGRSRELGLTHLPDPPYTLLASPTCSATDMDAARRLAAACDIFYTRGRAVAWFNSVLALLDLPASAFLERFADWLATRDRQIGCEQGLDDGTIRELQLKFLQQILGTPRLRRFLPLVRDLVEYHHRYAAALLSPSCTCDDAGIPPAALADLPLALSPSAQLADFAYDIIELLDAGAPDLAWMQAHLSRSGSCAVVYPHDGAVCTEAIAPAYAALLRSLDGSAPARDAARRCRLPDRELPEFLSFVWQEGIVTLPG